MDTGFRLRVADILYGAVEISVDGGSSWLLIARVVRPSQETASDKTAILPSILRAGANGIAVGLGGGKLIRLLPDSKASRKDRSAILVNVPSTFALFKDFLPFVGSRVEQVINRQAISIPQGYTPTEGDVFQITSAHVSFPEAKREDYAHDAADRYRDAALARLRAKGGKPTRGMLSVTAHLAPGDSPSAVTFSLDGAVIAIYNRPPYEVLWDTREWYNGEHLVEVRAYDAKDRIITQARSLILVDNRL